VQDLPEHGNCTKFQCMEAIQDVTWIKHLHASSPVERFSHGRFKVVTVAIPSTMAHHNEQYRYRMFLFDPSGSGPFMAVNLESDLLDGWRLTVQRGSSRRIADRFDAVPAYETFRSLALPLVDAETLYLEPCRRKTRSRPKP
jgi:hypothetical protein